MSICACALMHHRSQVRFQVPAEAWRPLVAATSRSSGPSANSLIWCDFRSDARRWATSLAIPREISLAPAPGRGKRQGRRRARACCVSLEAARNSILGCEFHEIRRSALRQNMAGQMKKAVGSLVTLASLGLAYLGTAQRADAADLGARPLLSPASMWTGLYGGINVGGFAASGDAQWSPLPSPAKFGAGAASGDLSVAGFATGFQGGYVVQLAPALVAGIEADFAGSHATSSALSNMGRLRPPADRRLRQGDTDTELADHGPRARRLPRDPRDAGLLHRRRRLGWGQLRRRQFRLHRWRRLRHRGELLPDPIRLCPGRRHRIRDVGPLDFAGGVPVPSFNDVSAVAAAPHFPNFPSAYSWTGFDVNEFRAAVSYRF
jgi:hypothetical protein